MVAGLLINLACHPSVSVWPLALLPVAMLALVVQGTRAPHRGRFVASGLMFAPAFAMNLLFAWNLSL